MAEELSTTKEALEFRFMSTDFSECDASTASLAETPGTEIRMRRKRARTDEPHDDDARVAAASPVSRAWGTSASGTTSPAKLDADPEGTMGNFIDGKDVSATTEPAHGLGSSTAGVAAASAACADVAAEGASGGNEALSQLLRELDEARCVLIYRYLFWCAHGRQALSNVETSASSSAFNEALHAGRGQRRLLGN
jgi:hypothetical protein